MDIQLGALNIKEIRRVRNPPHPTPTPSAAIQASLVLGCPTERKTKGRNLKRNKRNILLVPGF